MGLIQSQLLKSYIQNVRFWGLTTTLGGIAGSFLSAIGFILAGFFLGMRAMAGYPNGLDYILFYSLIIISLFGAGFLLGWLQKLFFQRSRVYNRITYLPLINGFIWLISLSVIGINLFVFEGNFLPYRLIIILFCTVVSNLIKGSIIKQILNF